MRTPEAPLASIVPVIYSTDIYSPPADPDDYFDLACMHSLTEIDLRAVEAYIYSQRKGAALDPGRH